MERLAGLCLDSYLTPAGVTGLGHLTFFVGYWPSDDTAVVAHEGTDPMELLSLLIDADILLVDLNPSLFPGLGDGPQAHDGFQRTQGITVARVLSAVKKIISDRRQKGHSYWTFIRGCYRTLGWCILEASPTFQYSYQSRDSWNAQGWKPAVCQLG